MQELPDPSGSKQRKAVIEPDELYGLFEVIAGFDPKFTRIAWPQEEQDIDRQDALKDSWFSVISHVPAWFSDRAVRDHYSEHSESITPNVIKQAWTRHVNTTDGEKAVAQAAASKDRSRANPASIDAVIRAKATLLVRQNSMSWEEAIRLVLERRQQLAVACPACKARPFSPCRNRSGQRDLPVNVVHPSRKELADEVNDGQDAGAA